MLGTDFQGCTCRLCVHDEGLRASHGRWIEMMSILSERQTRLYAAEKAMAMGHGGITIMAQVSGLSERTIRRGIEELEAGNLGQMSERDRRPGGGRKASEEVDPSLVDDLELLMGETTAGDPMRLLKWTTKSLRSIARKRPPQAFWTGRVAWRGGFLPLHPFLWRLPSHESTSGSSSLGPVATADRETTCKRAVGRRVLPTRASLAARVLRLETKASHDNVSEARLA